MLFLGSSIYALTPDLSITVSNSDFIGGKSDDSGAIYVDSTSDFHIYNCRFINNIAKSSAGNSKFEIQFLAGKFFKVILEKWKDRLNISRKFLILTGGLYVLNSLTVRLENVQFTQNSGNTGGALTLVGGRGDVIVSIFGCSFSNNSASQNGGAVYVTDTIVVYGVVSHLHRCSLSDLSMVFIKLKLPDDFSMWNIYTVVVCQIFPWFLPN